MPKLLKSVDSRNEFATETKRERGGRGLCHLWQMAAAGLVGCTLRGCSHPISLTQWEPCSGQCNGGTVLWVFLQVSYQHHNEIHP